jgi:deoxyribose-phosphate aldolase
MKTTLPSASISHTPEQLMTAARLALSCLDLTDLNDHSSPADIEALCWRAQGANGAMPAVAAVCVWPRLASVARQQLPQSIAVAAVANFPGGDQTVENVLSEVAQIRQAGAQEIDLVLPYRPLMAGHVTACTDMLHSVRAATTGLVLKVILETGELKQAVLIRQASQIALDCGADFLKTSTGKIAQGASLEATRIMLQTIQSHPCAQQLGFKASGGLRALSDVMPYLELVRDLLGAQALTASRCRIGASSLWSELAHYFGCQQHSCTA